MPFVSERDYNSQDATDGPLGFGLDQQPQHVADRQPGRRTERQLDGSGGFTPQYGVFDRLTLNGNGTYTLTKKDLTQYRFNASKQLAAMVDKNGNTIALAYTGALLTQITDTAGRI